MKTGISSEEIEIKEKEGNKNVDRRDVSRQRLLKRIFLWSCQLGSPIYDNADGISCDIKATVHRKNFSAPPPPFHYWGRAIKYFRRICRAIIARHCSRMTPLVTNSSTAHCGIRFKSPYCHRIARRLMKWAFRFYFINKREGKRWKTGKKRGTVAIHWQSNRNVKNTRFIRQQLAIVLIWSVQSNMGSHPISHFRSGVSGRWQIGSGALQSGPFNFPSYWGC